MKRVITTVVPLGAIVLLVLAVSAWAAPTTKRHSGGDHPVRARRSRSSSTRRPTRPPTRGRRATARRHPHVRQRSLRRRRRDQGRRRQRLLPAHRRRHRLRVQLDDVPRRRPDHGRGPILRRQGQHARDHRRHRPLPRRPRRGWSSTRARTARSSRSSSTSRAEPLRDLGDEQLRRRVHRGVTLAGQLAHRAARHGGVRRQPSRGPAAARSPSREGAGAARRRRRPPARTRSPPAPRAPACGHRRPVRAMRAFRASRRSRAAPSSSTSAKNVSSAASGSSRAIAASTASRAAAGNTGPTGVPNAGSYTSSAPRAAGPAGDGREQAGPAVGVREDERLRADRREHRGDVLRLPRERVRPWRLTHAQAPPAPVHEVQREPRRERGADRGPPRATGRAAVHEEERRPRPVDLAPDPRAVRRHGRQRLDLSARHAEDPTRRRSDVTHTENSRERLAHDR